MQVDDLVTSFVEKFDEGGDGILCSVLAENEIKLFLDSEIVDTPLTLRQLDGVRGGMSPTVFDYWRSELINENR
jgi:hypothetical protein